MKWWALQDTEDPEPYAVMALDDQGLPRRFVPGEGLVHWPALAMFVFGGETGARMIDETEARKLMDQGIGAIDPGFVVMEQGQAPTIPAPGEEGNGSDEPDPAAGEQPGEKPAAAAKPPAAAPKEPAATTQAAT